MESPRTTRLCTRRVPSVLGLPSGCRVWLTADVCAVVQRDPGPVCVDECAWCVHGHTGLPCVSCMMRGTCTRVWHREHACAHALCCVTSVAVPVHLPAAARALPPASLSSTRALGVGRLAQPPRASVPSWASALPWAWPAGVSWPAPSCGGGGPPAAWADTAGMGSLGCCGLGVGHPSRPLHESPAALVAAGCH